LTHLRQAAGVPSRSTLRLRLQEMAALGLLLRGRREGFPRALDYELAAPGCELLVVMEVLEAWLSECPSGPVEIGSQSAKGVIKALIEGWSSTVVRALAAKPLTLTEVDQLISGLNYPSLERRLGTMRHTGQIDPLPSSGPGTRYTVSRWLRRAMAPLAVAAQWERQHVPEVTAPFGRIDFEAAFLLVVPLVDLDEELSGTCRLAVEISRGGKSGLVGIRVEVEEGRVASYVTNLEGQADAWASGSAAAWLRAMIEHDRTKLEIGGDCRLGGDLIDALHGALFMQNPLSR
jgi:DNA-binding HxlR family transcriptional regulator